MQVENNFFKGICICNVFVFIYIYHRGIYFIQGGGVRIDDIIYREKIKLIKGEEKWGNIAIIKKEDF